MSSDRLGDAHHPFSRLLEKVRSHQFDLPPLTPRTSKRLLVLTSRDASVQDLMSILRHDDALAARVLSVANSALYEGLPSIHSIRQAALRLGAADLRDLILQAVVESQFKRFVDDKLLATCRMHAVAVAHLAKEICRVHGTAPDSAFMCGLLHDIGAPVLVHTLARGGFDGPLPEAAHSAIHSAHTLAGERVAKLWNLPDTVAEVIRLHHCVHGAILEPTICPEVAVVGAADRLAYHLELGGRRLGESLFEDGTWEQVGLSVEDIQHLVTFAERIPSVL